MFIRVVEQGADGVRHKAGRCFMPCVQQENAVLDQFLLREAATVMGAKDQGLQNLPFGGAVGVAAAVIDQVIQDRAEFLNRAIAFGLALGWDDRIKRTKDGQACTGLPLSDCGRFSWP